jgi:hypothetical protein
MKTTPCIPLTLRGRLKGEAILAFRHLGFVCHLVFEIWHLDNRSTNGLLTPNMVALYCCCAQSTPLKIRGAGEL